MMPTAQSCQWHLEECKDAQLCISVLVVCWRFEGGYLVTCCQITANEVSYVSQALQCVLFPSICTASMAIQKPDTARKSVILAQKVWRYAALRGVVMTAYIFKAGSDHWRQNTVGTVKRET